MSLGHFTIFRLHILYLMCNCNGCIFFHRLDKAVGDAHAMPTASLPEHVRSEMKVFQAEMRGQIYFHLSTMLFKMAQEVNALLFRTLQFLIRYLNNGILYKETFCDTKWLCA